jgi:hypothetical protein
MPTSTELNGASTLAAAVALYSAGTPDWQIASELNQQDTVYGVKKGSINTQAARRILSVGGAWTEAIKTGADANTPTTTAKACKQLIDILTASDTLDSADENALSAILETLVTASVVTAGQKTAIDTLFNTNKTWAEAKGIEVTSRSVGLARGAV